MYIKTPHAINILLFSATAACCCSPTVMIKYSIIPIIAECSNIVEPLSIVYYTIRNILEYKHVVFHVPSRAHQHSSPHCIRCSKEHIVVFQGSVVRCVVDSVCR